MPGPDPTTKTALESHWAFDGGLALGGSDSAVPGLDLELRRRIAFHPHTLQLGQLATNNHWSLDLGISGQTAGWAGKRPSLLLGAARFGISYNLLNIVGIGPTFRAGYASASDGTDSSGGALWSAGLRFGGIIDQLSVFGEVGYQSAPSPDGNARDKGAYGLAALGYLF